MSGRYGGEEFIALAYGIGPQDACVKAEQICTAIERQSIPLEDGHEARVTVSIGLFYIHPDSGDAKTAINRAPRQADAALYKAKSSGRNRFELAIDPARTNRSP